MNLHVPLLVLRLKLLKYFWTSSYLFSGTIFGPPSTPFSGDYFWTSLYLFPNDYFWNLPLLHSQENTFGPTSTSHRALELVAVVAVVLAVALRNTYCCFLYSSPVRNICSSAWNSLTTSPYKRKTISLNIAWVFFIHVLVLNWSYALWLKFKRSK